VFMLQPFEQLHIRNALVWEALRLASSRADLIYRRTLGWDSHISRAISCERVSFHSGNYGSSSTGVHTHYMGDLHSQVPQVVHFLSHGEAGPVFEIS